MDVSGAVCEIAEEGVDDLPGEGVLVGRDECQCRRAVQTAGPEVVDDALRRPRLADEVVEGDVGAAVAGAVM